MLDSALGPLRSERFLERPGKHAQPFAVLDLAPKGENDPLPVHRQELFNHHAERAGLDWVAQSRGLALERGAHNVGPISPFALHALKEMAITPRAADRFPEQCTADDLAGADFAVAVKEAEHRPLMRERFREWEQLPDYWNVHDVEDVAPADALPLLAQEVRTLLLSFR